MKRATKALGVVLMAARARMRSDVLDLMEVAWLAKLALCLATVPHEPERPQQSKAAKAYGGKWTHESAGSECLAALLGLFA